MLARLLEFGLRWPRRDALFVDWEPILAVIESEPADGPIHRAKNPKDWHWYVPGYHETVLINELTAVANWQRAGGKGARPKPVKRPWDKNQDRKITPEKAMDTDEFLKWFEGRFAKAE